MKNRGRGISVSLSLHGLPATRAWTQGHLEVAVGTTVEDLLAQVGLHSQEEYLIVLDGKRARPEDSLHEGARIVVFARIGGGG